jgi:hypothetical protein
MIHPRESERVPTAPNASCTNLRQPGATLAEHHARYLEERGVNSVEAAHAFRTVRKPSEIPDQFSSYQRRSTPALIAEFRSPDRVTVGWQMHPDRPRADRRGRVAKWMSPPAKSARMVLGVSPGMVEEVRSGTGPLWIVEGPTRTSALAGYRVPALTIAGVWNWQKDGRPLECWRHVNLSERLVLIAFDADARTNVNVQKALTRLVAYLESQGARVLVVSVPEVDGDPNTGLDDWIARNGAPWPLASAAATFVPADVGRERLRKDERLRLAVARIRRSVNALETREARECSASALARYLLGEAERHGKTTERGIRVRPSRRQMAAGVRVALATITKDLKHLEKVGVLESLRGNRAPHEAASYLLLYPTEGGSELSEHIEGRGVAGEEGTERGGEGESSLSERESFLSVHLTRGGMKSAPSREKLPALRNSKLVHEYARKDGRRVVVDSRYYPRYGKKCEAIIRYVLEAGRVHEGELHERFGSETSRLRDFRRTWLEKKMLKDGVLVRDGGWILPAPDWPDALERVRERTSEEEDNRRQDEKYAEQGRTFRERLAGEKRGTVAKPERVPELAGPERTAESVAKALEREDAAAIEEQRRKVGETAEVFIHDRLRELGSIRMELLREVWADRGGNPSHIWRTAKRMGCRFRKLPVYDNALFVYPPAGRPPAPVAVLREPENLRKPETESAPPDDWRSHPIDCPCSDCAVPMPTHARAWSGA